MLEVARLDRWPPVRIFLAHEYPDPTLELAIRAEGDGIVGDARTAIAPGQTFYGYTFDEIRAGLAVSGTMELDIPRCRHGQGRTQRRCALLPGLPR